MQHIFQIKYSLFRNTDKMLAVSAVLLGMSWLVVGARREMCAGCPLKVDVLSEAQQGVVDFAVLQLEGGVGGLCKKKVISTRNFSQQVSHLDY